MEISRFNELTPAPISPFSLLFLSRSPDSEWRWSYLSATTRSLTSHRTFRSLLEKKRCASGAIAPRDPIDHHASISSLDIWSQQGQSQSLRISWSIKHRHFYGKVSEKKKGRIAKKTDRRSERWHIQKRSRTGQCLHSEISKDIAWTCEVFAEGSRAIVLNILNPKLEYQPTFGGAIGGSIWETR